MGTQPIIDPVTGEPTQRLECAGGCPPSHVRWRIFLSSVVYVLLATLVALAGYCIWGARHG